MTKEIENKIEEILGMVKNSGQFVEEQLPVVVEEYLTYYAWMHGGLAILFLAGSVVLFYLFWRFKFVFCESLSEIDDELIAFFTPILGVLAFCLGVGNFFELLQVLIAPRVYIIENFASLIN